MNPRRQNVYVAACMSHEKTPAMREVNGEGLGTSVSESAVLTNLECPLGALKKRGKASGVAP